MTARVFPGVPIPVGPDGGRDFQRADITVSGLDHSGSSYEVRVFLNNPHADAGTPRTGEDGYAGSIYVYGYGGQPPGPSGDQSAAGAQARLRPPRSIIATEAVRAEAAKGPELTMTLVAIAASGADTEIDLDASPVSVRIDDGAGAGST